MKSAVKAALLILGLLISQTQLFSQQASSVYNWLDDIASELQRARDLAGNGKLDDAQSVVLRAYLDRFESLEGYYGPGAQYGVSVVADAVARGELAFHQLLRSPDAPALITAATTVEQQLAQIRDAVRSSGVQTAPDTRIRQVAARDVVAPGSAATSEIRFILEQLEAAATRYLAGNAVDALALVELAYLEGFEKLESRLPAKLVGGIEKTIHLQLRPAIRSRADAALVTSLIGAIGADLLEADRFLAKGGGNTAFVAINSFAIIVREGLEAVLLIAALLAYLGAVGAQAKHRRQLWTGVVAGVVASIGTWFVAATLLPISGAHRELLEGVTALVAVAVLLYVANWLFQKTYIHDWKDYLRARVGSAVGSGSAFALAALAFAAVYREGFETVLFYQALAFDAGVIPILAGFLPGILLIVGIGFAIIRMNAKLPLKQVFGWTNVVLMYLAFVFLGKGLYNLQEGGVFSPHPLPLPDHPALRQLFGFYPVVETICAQLALLLLIAGTYIWYHAQLKAKTAVT
ncbi:MAG: FTR1 family iron permease [Gemmatimonadota bacterium]